MPKLTKATITVEVYDEECGFMSSPRHKVIYTGPILHKETSGIFESLLTAVMCDVRDDTLNLPQLELLQGKDNGVKKS